MENAFSADDAAAELREFGSTVLREAWAPERLSDLRRSITTFLSDREERVAQARATPDELLQHQHGAGTVAMMQEQGFSDLSLLTDLFRNSPFHELCIAYLGGETFYAQANRLAFRRHDPKGTPQTYVPFHQDAPSQDPRVRNVLNCWIPLDDGAGRECPGLEVVRTASEPDFPLKIIRRPENVVYDPITIDADVIKAEFGSLLLAPHFALGDALVFTENVIHRTYISPEMTRPRLGFEFRVLAPTYLKFDRAPAGAAGLQFIGL